MSSEHKPSSRMILPILCLVGLVLGGCSPAAPPAKPVAARGAADHDHVDKHDEKDPADHKHPETRAAGVAEIESLWTSVRESLAKGKRDAADDTVHAAGHVLEDLEGLTAAVKSESREAAQAVVAEIFACFNTLDTALHGDEGDLKKVDLDALESRLVEAFGKLRAVPGADAKPAAEPEKTAQDKDADSKGGAAKE
ncbi:MAG: hypothetical protein ACKOTB_13565 [Planctomycetia bacterium]